jgi:transcriptional regulator with PAS, ATPase and Fis domain
VSVLLEKLLELCEVMARGSYDRHSELFELTKTGSYPEDISRLAEAFGMMMVKVESREYHLSQIIEELKRARAELAEARKRLADENKVLRKTIRETFAPELILGNSSAIQMVRSTVRKIADLSLNVLITGETGTGKDLIAQAIHHGSSRSGRHFVAINCTAIPESMLEAELFGIEKGVATGVDKRIGKIEQANGGTLFLDEIGDMPLTAQSKILRVLEERSFERVGGRSAIPVDIRLIAATNSNLSRDVEKGTFRRDLYYRLNVVPIHVPPLRERKDDIPLLLKEFLKKSSSLSTGHTLCYTPEILSLLVEYPWPGNVRQLKNEVERAIALASTDCIGLAEFSEEVKSFFAAEGIDRPLNASLRDQEIQTIRDILVDSCGNKSEAARRLGVSREGLRKKLRRYGIEQEI